MSCFIYSRNGNDSSNLRGLGPGDAVIVPAYTYTATASVVCHVGATPVMVDVEQGTYKMDKKQLASRLSTKRQRPLFLLILQA